MTLVAFYARPDRTDVTALAGRAATWLEERGHRAGSALQPDGSCSVDGADLLVSLGGDGTLLRAVESASGAGIPVLGVDISGTAVARVRRAGASAPCGSWQRVHASGPLQPPSRRSRASPELIWLPPGIESRRPPSHVHG